MKGNDIADKDGMNIDKDIDDLLAILHDIPQVPIPEGFEFRLQKALKEEGHRIREGKARTFTISKKRYIKAFAAVAACFVVVFAAISVYNDGSDGLLENQSLTYGVEEERAGGVSVPESSSLSPEDALMDANSSMVSSAPNNLRDYKACDDVDKENLAEEKEIDIYFELIKERFSGYEYEILACGQDEESGDYHFIAKITYDPQGKNNGKEFTFTGKLGEIYEGQGKKPKANSD